MIRVNGHDEDYRAESVAALIERLGIEPRGIAVAVDGEVVRRSDWPARPVADGARVEIVTAAAGG